MFRQSNNHATPSCFLLLAVCLWPATTLSAQSSVHRSFSDLESGVDQGIAPGDDFFGYANGQWLKQTEIPASRTRWTTRNEIEVVTRQQIVTLFEEATSAPSGSLARKVSDFLASYRTETASEAGGLAPLRAMLDSIERVRDKAGVTRLLGRDLGTDVDPLNWGVFRSSHLVGLSVEPGLHGEKTNVAFLLQGGLGLPDREHYLSAEPAMQAIRKRYEEYIARLLTLAGMGDAGARAGAVMALETALARSQATAEESTDDHYTGNRWSRADFASKAPGMDWSLFFTAAGLQRQDTLVPWQPSAMAGVAALVGSEAIAAWKDYLRFHLLDRYADVLPQAFAQAGLEMRSSVRGEPDQRSRDQRAGDAALLVLSDAVGRMYAEHYFPAEQQARLETIVARVIDAFRLRVQAVTWMSSETRAMALAKLKTLYFGVGYPKQWQDYRSLSIDRTDPVGNLRRIEAWEQRRMLARLGRPVDLTEWWIAPQQVGALLNFQTNSYNFPAALLQPGKFDPDASDAANYGAIGAIVGHEVSHFVDLLGADYDAAGRRHHWWTAEDKTGFQTRADLLARQVAGYRPLPDQAIDTRLTQTENIADLGGLVAAFDAYRRSLGNRASDTAYVTRQDRQFFIGFARSWRGKIREDAMPRVLQTDSHAPERYRIATVRNVDAWYAAFDVRPGQTLYLAPEERVKVW